MASDQLTPRSKLWDFFAKEHDLTLLGSQLDDIIHAVGEYASTEPLRTVLINDYTLPFFAVRYPEGDVDHCTIRLAAKDAIQEFMDTEIAMNVLQNAMRLSKGKKPRCARSWEQFEAEGFSVVHVRIFEVKP